MVIPGNKKDKGINVDNRQKRARTYGLVRLSSVLFIALVLSAFILATLPGSARVDEGAVTVPVADQSSGCPCNGQCGPQQAPPVAQPQIAEADTNDQVVPVSYSPPDTVQQPVVDAPVVNAAPVATSELKSEITGPVTNNKSISDMMGSFSLAGLKRFMPSLSVDNNQPVSMPGNGFMEKMKIKWPMFS